MPIAPLFDYQICGLKSVTERKITVTVYQYDSTGKVINAFARSEKYQDLYHSSINIDDIAGVTSFPFFASTDTIRPTDHVGEFDVFSSQHYLTHYLKDVKVYKNESGIERIEGKLLIHGYTIVGETLSYELYVAEFAKFGDCFLPKTIKFCPLEDIEYKHPRIVSEISYKLKQ